MAYSITDDTEYLDVQHAQLPLACTESIDGIDIKIEFLYNEPNDIYTAQFYDSDDNFIGASKLTYGQDILAALKSVYNFKTKIIPLDVEREKGAYKPGNPRVSIQNFGTSVFMVVFRG